jgi:hypothetical protein
MGTDSGWLTVAEVAVQLRCSRRRVTWLCKEGRITGAVKRLTPIPYYLIPADFEVLPSLKPVGNPNWLARKK